MADELEKISRASTYLGTLLRRSADDVAWLWDHKNLLRRYAITDLYHDLTATLSKAASWSEAQRAVRRFKQRHFLRIGGRDLLGLAELPETTAQLSDLAQVALEGGLRWLQDHPHLWAPSTVAPHVPKVFQQYRLTVLGLGKLGGRELNYVSDIDLLFLRQDKETSPIHDVEGLYETLCLVCQRLVSLLADSVEGDRVFHVDLRLRPQGKDGELVPQVAGAAYHYLLHGRAWERQMLLKARPVAGDRALGMAFLHEVRPFVFRRFLDFQALDELKGMRDRILQELRSQHADAPFDVKLGVGGIREVEFLVQSFQLIYGGRMPQLDEPNTLTALESLKTLGLLPADAAQELQAAYVFLRRVEHWIQLDQNRQTQKIPSSQKVRERLAEFLGFEGYWARFKEALTVHTQAVHRHFTALFQPFETGRPQADEKLLGQGTEEACLPSKDPHLNRLLPSLNGLAGPLQPPVLKTIETLAAGVDGETLEAMAARMDRYIAQVRRRPGLLHFLGSHRALVPEIFSALARCDLVADLLSRQPSLVEALRTWPVHQVLHAQWQTSAEEILHKASSYEEHLEWLRRLKNERFLVLALQDLAGTLAQGALERALADLADFVVRHTLRAVMDAVGLDPQLPLAVVALGSLGSREMDYLSDLDLIFVYEPPEGEKSDQIPLEVIRMLQRFMRMLSTPLQEGPGYEVDARLRPTGSYGPLVVTRTNWQDYYTHKADIWEIQALLRFRFVAGDPVLGMNLERAVQHLCFQERTDAMVWPRLCQLRRRMEVERTAERDDAVDIKLGVGGLGDLEFLIQGVQLIHGHENLALRQGSTAALLTEALAHVPDGPRASVEMLEAFHGLRVLERRWHLMTNRPGSLVTKQHFLQMTRLGLWPASAESRRLETWEDLLAVRRRIRRLFQSLCEEAPSNVPKP
ncbi:MAG: hypothetical protein ACUVWY_09205 [Desulfosoma sp.]|uniref:hypothetical protein n=1 Tax=Desulfosoma sp. TaxID=2603217 RepID=UPI00404BA35F